MELEKVIAVTHRRLCERPFLDVMGDLGKSNYKTIVLREKDLKEDEYESLLRDCIDICGQNKMTAHKYVEVARKFGIKKIHLPFQEFLESMNILEDFDEVGTSVHSVEEAKRAEAFGATYIFAGHIFVTDCKKGLEPRGVSFLTDVVNAVSIPVYGIGGIKEDNFSQILETGAAGGCIMSGCMR